MAFVHLYAYVWFGHLDYGLLLCISAVCMPVTGAMFYMSNGWGLGRGGVRPALLHVKSCYTQLAQFFIILQNALPSSPIKILVAVPSAPVHLDAQLGSLNRPCVSMYVVETVYVSAN